MSKEDMSGLDDTFNTDNVKAEVIPKTNKLHLKKDEGDDDGGELLDLSEDKHYASWDSLLKGLNIR